MADLLQYGTSGGGGGDNNYNHLINRPKVNDVTLSGNKTSAELGLQSEIPVIILDATPIDLGVIAMTKSRAYDSDYWLLSQMDGNENVSTGRISDIKAEILIYNPATKIGTYENVTLLKENDIVTTLTSDATDKPLSANMGKSLNDIKQNIQDNSLDTFNKTIVPAINEVNDIAKGAQQAISFYNYKAMVDHFNDVPTGEYNEGQNVMIVTLEVPDLWISAEESTYTPYIYIDDETIITTLKSVGYIQVGYYKLSQLETGKVDITNMVTTDTEQTISGNKNFTGNLKKNNVDVATINDFPVTDVQINGTSIKVDGVANIPVATYNTIGVVRGNANYGVGVLENGAMFCSTATETEITDKSNAYKPIAPSTLDKAVMEGLGNNSLTWSSAYKTSAQNTIGITTEQFVFTMASGEEITKNIKVSS